MEERRINKLRSCIIIHRGTHQIGGSVVEIKSENNRIIIDFGANLAGMDIEKSISNKKIIEDVFGTVESCDAVLFSHYHGDHYGMYKDIPKGIPIYIGRISKKILKILVERVDYISEKEGLPIVEAMQVHNMGVWKEFGDIKVMPLSIDHSAIDAYMFLIEVDNKRILYTGDFRDHGINSKNDLLYRMLERYVGDNIDVLITEGTMLTRLDESKYAQIITEEDLFIKAKEIFTREENKCIFVLVSSTNIDSIMGFYHAIPDKKAFVCDEYQAKIMNIVFEDSSLKNKKYKRTYFGNNPRPTYILNGSNELSKDDRFYRADFDIMKEKGFVMLVRANKNPKIELGKFERILKHFEDVNPLIIYSMWDGYLKGKHKDETIVSFIINNRMEYLHTSGHAYPETIIRLIEQLKPKVIIPIHTESPENIMEISAFNKFADRIVVLNDGETYTFEMEEKKFGEIRRSTQI